MRIDNAYLTRNRSPK